MNKAKAWQNGSRQWQTARPVHDLNCHPLCSIIQSLRHGSVSENRKDRRGYLWHRLQSQRQGNGQIGRSQKDSTRNVSYIHFSVLCLTIHYFF